MSRHGLRKNNPLLEFGIGAIIGSFAFIALQQFGLFYLIDNIGSPRDVAINKTSK